MPQRRTPSQPVELVLVRHAESVGNVADAAARRLGRTRLELSTRDADTPLSDIGQTQARTLGRHLAQLPPDEQPEAVLSSPYVRAAHTAQLATQVLDLDPVLDERLRERDLGVFDRLTGSGIRESYPEEARRRSEMGKFYYRPPAGESWTDVALRVRQVLAELGILHRDERVWIFTHQAVIMTFRLALEGLTEERLLEIDRSEPLANCSMTRYRRGDDGLLELQAFGSTAALEASDVPTTHEAPRNSGRVRTGG